MGRYSFQLLIYGNIVRGGGANQHRRGAKTPDNVHHDDYSFCRPPVGFVLEREAG